MRIFLQEGVGEEQFDGETVCLPLKFALGVESPLAEQLHIDVGMADRVSEFMRADITFEVFRQCAAEDDALHSTIFCIITEDGF